ncbi:hypothetical protein [Candidatus Epulonipiscium viviparus]|uniref:hypothetical protein n=1 Tax=Candidatus Epulonipiscium viviparus TaxID=420336 RepID=UPI00273815C6|nr:hypothetical protein [Candidatus Epulopiscium viviparus]
MALEQNSPIAPMITNVSAILVPTEEIITSPTAKLKIYEGMLLDDILTLLNTSVIFQGSLEGITAVTNIANYITVDWNISGLTDAVAIDDVIVAEATLTANGNIQLFTPTSSSAEETIIIVINFTVVEKI